jgi:hypothetical protein
VFSESPRYSAKEKTIKRLKEETLEICRAIAALYKSTIVQSAR